MKKNLKTSYTDFYRKNNPAFTFPPEWVVRTFLGNYPDLRLDKTRFAGSDILDMGFGDGRCFPLLHKLGFNLHGVELTEEILSLCRTRMDSLGIDVTLKTGSNVNIPYENSRFDFLLSSSSCYYVDDGTAFKNNLTEYCRVLKPGGYFIAAMPSGRSFVFQGADELGDGLCRIVQDPYNVRNGYTMKKFNSHQEIKKEFQTLFDEFSFGLCNDDYYGCHVELFLTVCRKKTVSV